MVIFFQNIYNNQLHLTNEHDIWDIFYYSGFKVRFKNNIPHSGLHHDMSQNDEKLHIYAISHHFGSCHDVTQLFFFNTLRPTRNARHFADNLFKWIFVNENAFILLKI